MFQSKIRCSWFLVAFALNTVLLVNSATTQEPKREITKQLDEGLSIANSPTSNINSDSNQFDYKSRLDLLDDNAKRTRKEGGRWFLAEYDFDSRGFNVLHFMGHSPLPFGFSMWGFIDIEGADAIGANREDFATYFLEIDIRKPIWKRAGVIGELNDLQGDDNAIGRFGVFWNPRLPDERNPNGLLAGERKIGFKIFPIETDRRGWQASMNWSKKFKNILNGRVSAGGFIDLNTNAGPADDLVVVTEHQIRYRLVEGLHLITEFRVNEFLQDDFGIAPGLQYRY